MKRKIAVVVHHYSNTNSGEVRGEVRAVFDTLDEARQFIINNTEDLPEIEQYSIYYQEYDTSSDESDCKDQ